MGNELNLWGERVNCGGNELNWEGDELNCGGERVELWGGEELNCGGGGGGRLTVVGNMS